MQTLIKRFLGQATDLNLVLLSLAAALFSTKIVFLNPFNQFLITSIVFLANVVILSYIFIDSRYFQPVFSLIQLFVVLALNFANIFALIATFCIISMFVAFPYEYKKSSMYLKAFSAHLADALVTYTALSSLEESNPIMRALIQYIGVFPALLFSKVGVISAVLFYTYREAGQEQEIILLKAIMVIGLSLAARNLLLFFNSGI